MEYVDYFMEKNSEILNKLVREAYGYEATSLNSRAFKSIAKEVLDIAYNKFTTDNRNTDLDAYLHGTLRLATKKIVNFDKQNFLICPGCLSKGKIEILTQTSTNLTCNNCANELLNSKTDNTSCTKFVSHSYTGLRCPKCSRFIPSSTDKEITCAYTDCRFKGEAIQFKQMPHPALKLNYKFADAREELINSGNGDNVFEKCAASEQINTIHNIILNCIDEQLKTLHYKCFPQTYIIKKSVYKAFISLLKRNPEEMTEYLSRPGRVVGTASLQTKIFQEFIKHLESELPYSFTKNKTKITIDNLLDNNIRIFDGESSFKAEITKANEIHNKTEEIYVGSRSGFFCQPYYLGKLLEIKDLDTGQSLMNKVRSYSCVKIDMVDVVPGTQVEVKHLRIPAHYNLGGFSYICRLKKVLVEKVQRRLTIK